MKHKIILVILFIAAVALYILTMKGVTGNPAPSMIKGNLDQATRPFELSPERGRYLLTMSLAEAGSFALPQMYADAAYPDVGYYQGRFYIFFAPGMSLFALPFYYIGKYFGMAQVGAFSVATIFTLLNLVVLYRMARDIFKLSVPHSLIPPFIFGFASTGWSYAVTLYQHQTSTFYILSGVYAVWQYSQKNTRAWAWALYVWFIYGCAILIDYPNALLMLPIMVYFFLSSVSLIEVRRKLALHIRWVFLSTATLFAIIMLAHGYYNFANFGGWTRVSGSLIGYKSIIEKQLSDPNKSAELQRLEQEKDPIGFFSEYNFPFGLYTLTVSSDRGLFVYYPIYLLALFGLYYAIKNTNPVHKTMIAVAAINFFLYASFGDPWGGWAFGPRYLIPTMAILSLYVALWLATTRYKIVSQLSAVVLFGYSLAIALAGVLTSIAIPPKIEADYLKTFHNFMLNFEHVKYGASSSVLFNEYFSRFMPLMYYYGALFGVVLVMFIVVVAWSRRYRYEY